MIRLVVVLEHLHRRKVPAHVEESLARLGLWRASSRRGLARSPQSPNSSRRRAARECSRESSPCRRPARRGARDHFVESKSARLERPDRFASSREIFQAVGFGRNQVLVVAQLSLGLCNNFSQLSLPPPSSACAAAASFVEEATGGRSSSSARAASFSASPAAARLRHRLQKKTAARREGSAKVDPRGREHGRKRRRVHGGRHAVLASTRVDNSFYER